MPIPTDMVHIYEVRTKKIIRVPVITKTDSEWQALLSPESFRIARKLGTEYPFTGRYHDTKEEGVYRCICCGTDLFLSGTKFDSGTGWPSFYAPVSDLNIRTIPEPGSERIEVVCSRCGAHLGHVFDDGPEPTHLRYCMNSGALLFEKGEF